jgi:hypothetical protein
MSQIAAELEEKEMREKLEDEMINHQQRCEFFFFSRE